MFTLLILETSGGAGLIQVATAKAQELKSRHPDMKVVRRDLLLDGNWPIIGRWGVWQWNRSQRKGDVKRQEFLIRNQWVGDLLFAPYIFVWFFLLLLRVHPDQIYDTQPIGTKTLLRALRLYNWWTGRSLTLEKVLVDFPTDKNSHFLWPVRKIRGKELSLLRFVTIPPCLKKGETAEEFWRRECGIPISQVKIEPSPVREAFVPYRNKIRTSPFQIPARIHNAEEAALLSPLFSRPLAAGPFSFSLQSDERLITILLGSQPARGGTLAYVKGFHAKSQETDTPPTTLVVLAGRHVPGERSLFREVALWAASAPKTPLRIIPLSFQSEETIAALFHRSDLTLTRSGGSTCHELLAVSTGEIWIHSEAKEPKTEEDLLSGIPGWEGGNALYMKQVRGARIVTPDTFLEYWEAGSRREALLK